MGLHPTTSAERDPEGTFTVAWTVPPAGFDPHVGPEHLAFPALAPIYDRLLLLEADGSLGPMLATEWAFSDDGSRLSLQLRRGVAFHDGLPFDARAVQVSIERAQSPAASAVVNQALAPIVGVDTVDDHHVELRLDDRAAGVPAALATPAGMMVSPAAVSRGDVASHPIGTGAYVVDQKASVAGSRASYVRAPGDYWDSEGQQVAGFDLVGIPANEERLEALLDGRVDVIDVRGEAVPKALEWAANGDFQLATYRSDVSVALLLNRGSPQLADVRVRRALNLAIDRATIVTELFHGRATTTVQSLPPGRPGHDPQLELAFAHDPAEARRLLASAGASGLELDGLQFAGVEPMTTMLEVVRRQLADVGVRLRLCPMPPAELVAAWHRGGFDVRGVFASSLPDPALVLHRRLNDVQSPGDLAVFSEALPGLVAGLLDQRMSPAATEELHAEINRRMVEDAVMVEICRPHLDVMAGARIRGVDRIPYASLNLYDVRHLGVTRDGGPRPERERPT